MKTKFRNIRKGAVSFLLTLLIIISVCTVGISPVSAAVTKDNAEVGANTDVGTISEQETHTLTITYDTAYGTVTGAGTYESGTVVDITATPAKGYYFSNWTTLSGDSSADSTAESTTVTLTQDTALRANFAEAAGSGTLHLNGATIKINSSTIPTTSGTASLNITGGSPMTLNATKRAQVFIKWEITNVTEGVDYELVDSCSTDATITFLVLKNDIKFVIKPIFSSDAHTVTFQDWDGTVLRTQGVIDGEGAIAPADPTRDGYVFAGWDKDYSSITEDTVITATYVINKHNLTINSSTGGTTSPESTEVGHGNTTTITAIPDSGYAFTGWSVVSGCTPADLSSASTTVTITEDTVLTANFKQIIVQATFESDDDYSYVQRTDIENSGLVNNLSTTLVPGDSISITAFRLKGGTFNRWVISGAVEGTDYEFTSGSTSSQSITIRILDTARPDLTLVAKAYYSVVYYSVTFVDWNGAVLSTQTVAAGDAATAPEDPTRESYSFAGWDKDFSVITEDTEITATYILILHDLTVNAGAGGTASAENSEVVINSNAVIAAIPDYGYTFTGWTVNSGDTPADLTSACTTVPITQDTVLTASFAKIPSVSDHSTLFDLATSDNPYVYINKDVYTLGEAIYAVADKGTWIGVYSLDVTAPTADDTLYYSYNLSGNEGKAVDIRSGEKHTPLVAGDYVVYLFEDEGYNAIAADTFTIYNPDNSYDDSLNMILSSKSDYTYGEAVHLTAYTTSEYLDKAWVGVYPAGADYTTTSAKYMYFVKDHLGKTVNLIENSEINTGAKLSAGSYDIYLFGSDDFSTELVKITINVSGGSVSTNKDTYTTFPDSLKTENILTLAELYDADNTPINNYITPTVDNLRVYRYSDGTDALQTIKKGSPYRLINAVDSGMAYVEYTEGKYGYCTFECITRYEYSDVVIDGYIKIATTLYADYDRETTLKELEVNTPVSVIENDSTTVKIQVGGVIGYAEYYHISMTATPHSSDFATVDSGAWVGIYPEGTTPDGTESAVAWYTASEFWNSSVSLKTLASGDGTLYAGTDYLPAGTYTAYLFGDSGCTNIIDSTSFATQEASPTGTFINGTYDIDNLTDGFANGTVTIELDPDNYGFIHVADAALYWADAQGNPLEGYSSFANVILDKPVYSFDLFPYTFIPEGAATLAAYVSYGTAQSTTSYIIPLPEGTATYAGLDSEPYTEFQVLSDTKVGNTTSGYHYDEHFVAALTDIANNSTNSAGIFINGDVTNTGAAAQFDAINTFAGEVATATGKTVPSIYIAHGNTDSQTTDGMTPFLNFVNNHGGEVTADKPYYSVMIGGYKFIFLAADVSEAKIDATQIEWLDAELTDNEENNEGKPVFLFCHYALDGGVLGSLTNRLANTDDLTAVLRKYNNIISFSGHYLADITSPENAFGGNVDLPVAINAGATSRTRRYINGEWDAYDTNSAQGLYVRIYDDKIVVLGRDFINNLWLPSACYVFYNEDVSFDSKDAILDFGNQISADDFVTNQKGRDLIFESSDTTVATVDAQGNITAVGEGEAVITVTAVATDTEVITRGKIKIVVPLTRTATITYLYEDRSGNEQTYLVVHELSDDEILGFEGNNFTPYAPAYISGEGWINSVLVNSPYIVAITEDIAWAINSDTYDTSTFVLKATQTDRLFTITSQVGEAVEINQKAYGELLAIDARHLDENVSSTGFWYNDTDNDGKYTDGTDLMLTYGPRFAYRITCDMNINYEETDKYDFNITIDSPAYGRSLTSSTDGTVADKVTVDYMINILTPYFYGFNNEFVPSENVTDNPSGQHVTVESLRNAGYTVNFGVILEQVGSFAPGSEAYPTFEDALTAAKGVNYGTATSSQVLTEEVINGYTAPVKTSVGTYCTIYDCSDYNITNKNRFGFTIGFKNTAANHKKFFNVYSYVTVTTPEKVTTTYLSNVQTLNIYNAGTPML